jgi:hypothetical protein
MGRAAMSDARAVVEALNSSMVSSAGGGAATCGAGSGHR